MRISDWSSDVCSSDLDDLLLARVERVRLAGGIEQHGRILDAVDRQLVLRLHRRTDDEHVICGTVLECDRAILGMDAVRSEEHTSELQSLMRNSYAVFCLKKKIYTTLLHKT